MAHSEFYPCGKDYPATSLAMFTVCGTASLLTAVVSVVTPIRLKQQFHDSSKEEKWGQPKSLYCAQLMFYAFCLIEALTLTPSLVGNCYGSLMPQWLHSLFFWLSLTSYYAHWIALLTVLFLRLRTVFDVHGGGCRVSPTFTRVSLGIMVSASVLYCMVVAGSVVATWKPGIIPLSVVFLSAALMILILLSYSLVLAFTFVRRLFNLNRLRKSDQDEFVQIMTRMTIIAIVSVTASVVVSVTLIVAGSYGANYTPWSYLILITALSADVLVDVICIALPLASYDKHYQCLCSRCDAQCKVCCARLAKASRGKAESELVAAVSANQNMENGAQSGSPKEADGATATTTTSGTTIATIAPSVPGSSNSVSMVITDAATGNVAIIH